MKLSVLAIANFYPELTPLLLMMDRTPLYHSHIYNINVGFQHIDKEPPSIAIVITDQLQGSDGVKQIQYDSVEDISSLVVPCLSFGFTAKQDSRLPTSCHRVTTTLRARSVVDTPAPIEGSLYYVQPCGSNNGSYCKVSATTTWTKVRRAHTI